MSLYGFRAKCYCLGDVYGYKSENCSIFKFLKSRVCVLCMCFFFSEELKRYLYASPQASSKLFKLNGISEKVVSYYSIEIGSWLLPSINS